MEFIFKDEGFLDVVVVFYKDLSISEVMVRYFFSVEGFYVGIVINVVWMMGKFERVDIGVDVVVCGFCGIVLDECGDEIWVGELGE